MTKYETLLCQATEQGAKVIEIDLGTDKPCGKCIDNILIINNRITEKEKHYILAEELGHYLITVGDITNQKVINNRKQELKARRYSHSLLIEPIDLIESFRHGSRNTADMAEFLDISVNVLYEIIEDFKKKYGMGVFVGNYYLKLQPTFGIVKDFGLFNYNTNKSI